MNEKLSIVVLGCGVIGLTSALRLQEHGFAVKIVARDIGMNLTSVAAGAYWYGGHDGQGQHRRWAETSLRVYLSLIAEGAPGIQLVRFRDVFNQPMPDPWYADLLPFFRRLTVSERPTGYADGFLLDIPLVEPPVYLEYLRERFVSRGGVVEQREIQDLNELDSRIVVNCSGVWARQIADDASVYPLRGQVMRVNAPSITQGFTDDEAFTYILPRPDGVILGGVSQMGNWSLDPDPAINSDILRRCHPIEPALAQAPVIATQVGLRPGRYAVRLEAERRSGQTIIHNYGHAGVGYTLSWGCAADVVEIVKTPA